MLLVIRSVIGTIGFTCLTFGMAFIPLVVQNTIFNTAPFWTSLLGWVFLGEAMSAFEIVALVLSFGGVILIATSSSIYDKKVEVIEETNDEADADGLSETVKYIIGSSLVFCTSWCYASVTILTRRM